MTPDESKEIIKKLDAILAISAKMGTDTQPAEISDEEAYAAIEKILDSM